MVLAAKPDETRALVSDAQRGSERQRQAATGSEREAQRQNQGQRLCEFGEKERR